MPANGLPGKPYTVVSRPLASSSSPADGTHDADCGSRRFDGQQGAYMRRTFIVSAFLLGAITSTQADDMAIMGWGASTCGQFANMYRDQPQFAEANTFRWAQAFMSGLNFERMAHNGVSMNLGSMSTDEQQREIRTYCNDHQTTWMRCSRCMLICLRANPSSIRRDPPLGGPASGVAAPRH